VSAETPATPPASAEPAGGRSTRYPWGWRGFAAALLLLRTAMLVLSCSPGTLRVGDEPFYDQLARSLLAGDGYARHGAPTVYRPPGWPLTLAAIYRVAGDDRRVVVAVQGLFDAGTILLCGWLAGRLFASRTAGAVGFLLALVWPPFFRESRYLQTEPMFTFLATAVLVAFARFAERPRPRLAFGVGVVAGLGALVRPTGVLVLQSLVLGWLIQTRHRLRAQVAPLAAMLLGLGLVLAPWTLRNWEAFHVFIPLSIGAGEQFYTGVALETEGRWDLDRWATIRGDALDRERHRVGHPLDAIEQDRALMRAGIEVWKTAPWPSTVISIKRFWRLCFLPLSGDDRPWLRVGFLLVLAALYGVALPSGARGLRDPTGPLGFAGVLLIATLAFSLASSFFYTNSRYFESVRPMLLVLAAGPIAGWIDARLAGRTIPA